jgi:hypothetical protein
MPAKALRKILFLLLMYKCFKKTSERFLFAGKDLKVGVLGIAGNHCTVTVQ